MGRKAVRIVLEKMMEKDRVKALVLQREINPRPDGEGWTIGPTIHRGRHLWVLGGQVDPVDVELLERLLLEGYCNETLRVEDPRYQGEANGQQSDSDRQSRPRS